MADAGCELIGIKYRYRDHCYNVTAVHIDYHCGGAFPFSFIERFHGGFLNFQVQRKHDVAARLGGHGNGIGLAVAEVVDQDRADSGLAAKIAVKGFL